MAATKVPARSLTVQVRAADGTTYVTVAGVTQWMFNPSEGEEMTDTTTYDSAGNVESRKMQVGATLTAEGFIVKDNVTDAQDAGQARIETLAGLLAEDSLGRVRFRHPAASVWKVWDAVFSVGEQGGGSNDMTSWNCTITRSGAPTTAAV